MTPRESRTISNRQDAKRQDRQEKHMKSSDSKRVPGTLFSREQKGFLAPFSVGGLREKQGNPLKD
jgi:hypothetical protein